MRRGRPLDGTVTEAIAAAALALLVERGFAGTSMEAIARRAGVGKPALYRRFPDKAALVVAAIGRALPAMEPPPAGPARTRLRALLDAALPADPATYLGLIGGLAAEHRRHPELIATFRTALLHPRRRVAGQVIADGQAAGEVRRDLSAERILDLFAGPIVARAFAGLDVGPEWAEAAFDDWWRLVATREA